MRIAAGGVARALGFGLIMIGALVMSGCAVKHDVALGAINTSAVAGKVETYSIKVDASKMTANSEDKMTDEDVTEFIGIAKEEIKTLKYVENGGDIKVVVSPKDMLKRSSLKREAIGLIPLALTFATNPYLNTKIDFVEGNKNQLITTISDKIDAGNGMGIQAAMMYGIYAGTTTGCYIQTLKMIDAHLAAIKENGSVATVASK